MSRLQVSTARGRSWQTWRNADESFIGFSFLQRRPRWFVRQVMLFSQFPYFSAFCSVRQSHSSRRDRSDFAISVVPTVASTSCRLMDSVGVQPQFRRCALHFPLHVCSRCCERVIVFFSVQDIPKCDCISGFVVFIRCRPAKSREFLVVGKARHSQWLPGPSTMRGWS